MIIFVKKLWNKLQKIGNTFLFINIYVAMKNLQEMQLKLYRLILTPKWNIRLKLIFN
jgi:hypothetical protein